jgi:uncharacterized protein (TIGR02996 family)
VSSADLPSHLHDAVLARPDDDEPRLACADWYEHNGQPDRARFIRLQCEAERLPPGHALREELTDEASRISMRLRQDWLNDRPTRDGVWWDFDRGFPERVTFSSFKALEQHRAEVFRFPVRRIIFARLRSISRLAACPVLEQVRELDLSGCNLGDEEIRILAASPHLGRITWLNLSPNGFGPAGIEALTTSRSLRSLAHLELRHIRLGPAGAQVLANWPGAAQLRYLGLQRCRLADEGLCILAGSAHLNALEAIHLGLNRITRAGLAALADAACWSALRTLLLHHNQLGNDGAGELARARHWKQLSTLDLSCTGVGDAGAVALAGAAHLARLEGLDLNNNAIGDAGARALAGSGHLSSLWALSLYSNVIGDEGGWALGRSQCLPALRRVYLWSNAMRPVLAEAVQQRYAQQNPSLLDGVPALAAKPIPAEPPGPLPQGEGPIDEEALWQAIVDDPDDDLPRLVYADWLDEHGQAERSRLLRERTVGVADKATIGPLADHVSRALIDRGLFRVVIGMRAFLRKAFQQNGTSWLRQARIHGLELEGTTKNWQRVADSPVLAAVHELHLSGHEINPALAALAGSPHLAGLHTLCLRKTNLDDRFMSFLETARLPRLRRLLLDEAGLQPHHLRALVDCPQAARLTTLSLRKGWLGQSGVAILIGAPALAGLRHLDLNRNAIRDTAARALAGASHWSSLESLDLSDNPINDDGARALVESPHLARLRLLTLPWGRLSPELREQLLPLLAARRDLVATPGH